MKISESSVNMASSREYSEADWVQQIRATRWDTVLSDAVEFVPDESTWTGFTGRPPIMQIQVTTLSGNIRSTQFLDIALPSTEEENAILNNILDSLFPGSDPGSPSLSLRGVDFALFPVERRPFERLTFSTPRFWQDLNVTSTETTVFSHHEKEETGFTAGGMVKTEDGRQIDFTLGLDMGREFLAESSQTIDSGPAKLLDPLVINFDGNLPELSDITFEFDLNVDGEMDEISQLLSGSGFLAFDRNGDGIINDGSELFGALTDDGFAELAEYDEDGNNWIDENDAIFHRLSIWGMDGEGEDTLDSLLNAGIGAIHLASADTLFDLTDDENNLLARVEKTGVYLEEDGDAGSIQQVKFALAPPTSVA